MEWKDIENDVVSIDTNDINHAVKLVCGSVSEAESLIRRRIDDDIHVSINFVENNKFIVTVGG